MEKQNAVKLTPQSYITTITIIHLGMFTGVAIFAIVVYLQLDEGSELKINYSEDLLFFLVPLAAVGAYFLGDMLFHKKIDALIETNSLKEKIMGYQTAFIIRLALLEGSAFFALSAYIIMQNLYYLLIFGLILLLFLLLKPSKQKIENDLKLNQTHRSQFADLKGVIDE